jgi:hypothetical protein
MEWYVPVHFGDNFQINRYRTVIEWYSKGAAMYKSESISSVVDGSGMIFPNPDPTSPLVSGPAPDPT